MLKNNRSVVRKLIVCTGLILRLGVIVSPFFLKDGGFLPDEFNILFYILIPISCLLLALFIKYIVQNRYQRPGPLLTNTYVGLGLFFLLFVHLAELCLIVYRGLYGSPEGGQFFLDIALLEACTAAYAGFYLSTLFAAT